MRATNQVRLVLTATVILLSACASSSPAAEPPAAATSSSGAGPAAASMTAGPAASGTTAPPLPPSSAAPATTANPAGSRHVFPATAKATYGSTHHDYPATDIFAACGSTAVSPVDGVIVHWRTTDTWEPKADNPALRGGLSVAVLGDDGVRYYLSHFSSMQAGLGVGTRVRAGQPLAAVGRTGNARDVACHIHFGLSPNCPTPEWSVRRGVIPPAPYLDAWRDGHDQNPSPEVTAWARAHPTACAQAAADPNAADAG